MRLWPFPSRIAPGEASSPFGDFPTESWPKNWITPAQFRRKCLREDLKHTIALLLLGAMLGGSAVASVLLIFHARLIVVSGDAMAIRAVLAETALNACLADQISPRPSNDPDEEPGEDGSPDPDDDSSPDEVQN